MVLSWRGWNTSPQWDKERNKLNWALRNFEYRWRHLLLDYVHSFIQTWIFIIWMVKRNQQSWLQGAIVSIWCLVKKVTLATKSTRKRHRHVDRPPLLKNSLAFCWCLEFIIEINLLKLHRTPAPSPARTQQKAEHDRSSNWWNWTIFTGSHAESIKRTLRVKKKKGDVATPSGNNWKMGCFKIREFNLKSRPPPKKTVACGVTEWEMGDSHHHHHYDSSVTARWGAQVQVWSQCQLLSLSRVTFQICCGESAYCRRTGSEVTAAYPDRFVRIWTMHHLTSRSQ